MRKTLVMLMLVLGVFALASGHAAEPSAGCTGSPLPPETAPSGISISNSGDPTTGAGVLRICNNGAVIPAAGALTLSGDPTHQKGYLDVDGNTSNSSLAACADGFFRIVVDGSGPHFYEAPNGNMADTVPGGTAQPAHEVSPDVFVTDTVANCGPALPPPPVVNK